MGGILTVKLCISKIIKWSEYIVGIYFLSMGASVVLIDIFRDISIEEKFVEIIMGVIFIVLGIIFWKLACKRRKLICSAKRYGRYLREGDFYQFSELASVMGTDNDTLTADIETLLEKGYLKNIVIDYQNQKINMVLKNLKKKKSGDLEVEFNNSKIREKINKYESSKDSLSKKNEKEIFEENRKRTGKYIILTLAFIVVGTSFFVFGNIILIPIGIIGFVVCMIIVEKREEQEKNSCEKCFAWNSMELVDKELLDEYKKTIQFHDEIPEKSVTTYRDKWGMIRKDLTSETITYRKNVTDKMVLVKVYNYVYKCKKCGHVVRKRWEEIDRFL